MKKTIYLVSSAILLISLFYLFSANQTQAAGVTITPNATEHIVPLPYEKSFIFVTTIENNSNTTQRVQGMTEAEVPEGWHVLSTIGQYDLAPGEKAEYIAVIEPGIQHEGAPPPPSPGGSMPGDFLARPPAPTYLEETVTVPIDFRWEGGSQHVEVTVKTKSLDFMDKEDDLSEVTFQIVDQDNKPIKNAVVVAMLASGLEQISAEPKSNNYVLKVPSGDYLQELKSEYDINQTSTGYYLQVAAPGYQGYFESNFLPEAGEGEQTITLEPLEEVSEYTIQSTIDTGYSIWWIRASDDEKFFAFSQGTHGQPGTEPPDKTKVVMADADGNQLWEQETRGECWGLDISPNGEYVSAACGMGDIYLWNQAGQEVWTYTNSPETSVRWVEFSPNNQYLLSGPVNGRPEEIGLFEVSTGELLWTFYTGDYLREGRFSADGQTVYTDCAHGLVHAFDTVTGDYKWKGLGAHVIPFLLGISEQANIAITTGKGRAFTALDLTTGDREWQTTVDQTVTAADISLDGTVVGGTVGGMIYQVSPSGDLNWAREYGGLGHNGLAFTPDGQYTLLGGPNPTLFDGDGNVLWQPEPDKEIMMTGVVEIDTGGANDVWLSQDASSLVLGLDDGKVVFYKGGVSKGDNTYSQLTGPGMIREHLGQTSGPGFDWDDVEDVEDDDVPQKPFPWVVVLGVFGLVVVVVIVVVVILVSKRKK